VRLERRIVIGGGGEYEGRKEAKLQSVAERIEDFQDRRSRGGITNALEGAFLDERHTQ
jgi:hypothetical protein